MLCLPTAYSGFKKSQNFRLLWKLMAVMLLHC